MGHPTAELRLLRVPEPQHRLQGLADRSAVGGAGQLGARLLLSGREPGLRPGHHGAARRS